MWGLLPMKIRIGLVIFASMGVGLAWSLYDNDLSLGNVLTRMVTTIPLLAILGAGIGKYIKASWIFPCRYGLDSWYPNLNGEWTGKLISTFLNEDASNEYDVTFNIDQRWSHIKILENAQKRSKKSTSRSKTLHVIPEKSDSEHRLWMIFQGEVQNPEETDDQFFYGSSRLIYDKNTDTLYGHHWTNRAWQRKMNTAGTLTLSRSEKQ